MNYFELFGFPVDYSIDNAQLSERYRDLQRAVHPDKFANSSEQQKRLAVQKTAQINDGFQTLKNPIRRAEHMLALRGLDISHDTSTVKDRMFLMQQMEWREALEEIRDQNDPHQAVDHLRMSFSEHQKSINASLVNSLTSMTEEDNNFAADQIRKLKFMTKLEDELTRIEDALFDL
ncbi:co-chaperone HscB [Shewanella sp. 202IG2-18]|uniref:co-chaperone HscB n=1 Tax=Parashewanella hymeniacidonis TaxID=2807618 RepID=UPI0019600E2E|nr:co-chaperone HscB [Parashewanella hymeniacidonis]MBM7074305.1 co-chaperone HscB [Parashewanella hymeniacidonis]